MRQNGRDAGGPRRAAAVLATSRRGRDGDGFALRVLEPEDDLDESVRGAPGPVAAAIAAFLEQGSGRAELGVGAHTREESP
jgi:hypothetical protein